MKKYLVMAMAAVAMVGCTQNEDENIDNGLVEIKLNAGITAAVGTRAALNPGEAVTNVQFAKIEGAGPDWTEISTPSFTGNVAATTGEVTFSSVQYYPSDGTATNLVAYYPAAKSIAAGVATMEITGNEDVLYASPISGTKTNPMQAFALAHKLTQFSFLVAKDANVDTDVTEISINVKEANTTFTMALANGNLNTWGTAKNIAVLSSGTTLNAVQTAGIMLQPEMSSITLTVSAKGYTEREVTIAGTDPNKFEAGKAYVITLTFKPTAIESTATIEEWTPGTGGGSDID